MSVASREVRILNRRGLHARASAKFVTLASGFSASVTVSKDGTEVAGTSIMGLMMLGAAMGDMVVISTQGANHEEALAQLVTLVEDKFGED
ncbi:MAG: HPr family phosphocarrier protein [Sphingomonadales bacterium]|nr:MAG: HPr family phosphocarrier protein [Sphingomonadales bacterium]TNF04103.1 MAG: HPr family phosphocarrier protein [Sphingomonadales bacterium]